MDYRIGDYKELIVWKRSMELAKAAYLLMKMMPREERYALSDQIRRSAVSIPSNIAEGYGRTSPKDYVRFLSIARGSSYELETQLLLSIDLGYFTEDDALVTLASCKEIAKMLTRIIHKLENK